MRKTMHAAVVLSLFGLFMALPLVAQEDWGDEDWFVPADSPAASEEPAASRPEESFQPEADSNPPEMETENPAPLAESAPIEEETAPVDRCDEGAHIFEGAYYRLISDLSKGETELLALELDMRFEVYNQLCRLIVPQGLEAPLNVRVFADRSRYNDCLREEIGTSKDGSIYIHYSNPEKARLVVIRDGSEDRSFSHQTLIQYLRAAISNPPSWLREGLAIYFDALRFDRETRSLLYEENLAWLDTVKAWQNPPAAELLLRHDFMESGLEPRVFAPASWALVSFLLNAPNEDYRRSFHESLLLLDPLAPAAENASMVMARISAFTPRDSMEDAYRSYIDSRQTFAALIESGRAAYAAKNPELAEFNFLEAANLRPTHHAPFYYLGLLSYENRFHEQAEQYYLTALNLGADDALVSYALGINALAEGDKESARSWLEKAKTIDPERYSAKADDLLAKL